MFLRRPPLRPFWGSKQPKCENYHFWGPFWPPLRPRDSRDGPNGIKNSFTQSTWVGPIHIIHLGPLMDLYGTPGAPKGLILAPKGPCGVPRGPRRAPGGAELVPTAPDWLIWVELMVTIHFDLVSGPFWAPRGPKRPSFGPKCPFWGPRRSLEGPRRPNLVPTAPHWPAWDGLMFTTQFDMVSGPFWAP